MVGQMTAKGRPVQNHVMARTGRQHAPGESVTAEAFVCCLGGTRHTTGDPERSPFEKKSVLRRSVF